MRVMTPQEMKKLRALYDAALNVDANWTTIEDVDGARCKAIRRDLLYYALRDALNEMERP